MFDLAKVRCVGGGPYELEKTATADSRVAPVAADELPARHAAGPLPARQKARGRRHGRGLSRDRSRARSAGRDQSAAEQRRRRARPASGSIREARAQARVHHPNVAHIYFIGEDAGRLYFAMEYVTGKTLADPTARCPSRTRCGSSTTAVLGLREAQRSGFTHRDVKPSNLMVDAHGVAQGPRLRHRGRRSSRARRRWPGRADDARRHAALHGARTGARRADRFSRRHLRARRDAVSARQRQAAVQADTRRGADHAARECGAPGDSTRLVPAHAELGARRADRAG